MYIENLLIVGLDTVALARSAYRAGYNVYAVDYFGDQDLRMVCTSCESIISQQVGRSCGHLEDHFSPKKFLDTVKKISETCRIDGILLASGLEDSQEALLELNKIAPIIGNSIQSIKKVRDKTDFFYQIQKLGINCPKTLLARTIEEVREATSTIGYPILLKPLYSLGGSGITFAENETQLTKILGKDTINSKGLLIQEYIPGKHVSTSFISTRNRAVVLSLNEQLLGVKEVGQKNPFGYCGNIVPAEINTEAANKCKFIAEKISAHFNLLGSNGLDIILNENNDPYVIEVNPRFQGTFECVEKYLGINLVRTHLNACLKGVAPILNVASSDNVFVRLIVFAPYRAYAPDLSKQEGVRDIPVPGVIIEEGEPVCSIIMAEQTCGAALERAVTLASRISKSMFPAS
jgi:predicted ATP-grasp superfamily ATP-dependent carboligase